MKKKEVYETIDFVLQEYKIYGIEIVTIEIKAFNFLSKPIWCANFVFYEDSQKHNYRYFHCGNTPETQNLRKVKKDFLNFCENFYRPKCEKCGQYLDNELKS